MFLKKKKKTIFRKLLKEWIDTYINLGILITKINTLQLSNKIMSCITNIQFYYKTIFSNNLSVTII